MGRDSGYKYSAVVPLVGALITLMSAVNAQISGPSRLPGRHGRHPRRFGSPDDVRNEVRQRIDVLGRGGGYILGPSHWIQAGTPAENVLAMFDTATRYYPH